MGDFKTDFDDKLYAIRIEVYRNGTIRQIYELKDGYKPTYQEIIGAVEVVKAAFLRDLGESVSEAYKKHKMPDGDPVL